MRYGNSTRNVFEGFSSFLEDDITEVLRPFEDFMEPQDMHSKF
jgi:hypothetical protein